MTVKAQNQGSWRGKAAIAATAGKEPRFPANAVQPSLRCRTDPPRGRPQGQAGLGLKEPRVPGRVLPTRGPGTSPPRDAAPAAPGSAPGPLAREAELRAPACGSGPASGGALAGRGARPPRAREGGSGQGGGGGGWAKGGRQPGRRCLLRGTQRLCNLAPKADGKKRGRARGSTHPHAPPPPAHQSQRGLRPATRTRRTRTIRVGPSTDPALSPGPCPSLPPEASAGCQDSPLGNTATRRSSCDINSRPDSAS